MALLSFNIITAIGRKGTIKQIDIKTPRDQDGVHVRSMYMKTFTNIIVTAISVPNSSRQIIQ